MKFLSRLRIEGLNERPLTESDFYRICQSEGITVLEQDVETSFYMCVLERPVIVIKKRQRRLRKLFSMFHELGHHFCHGGRDAGTQAFWLGMLETRNEAEADAFAAIALCPRPALYSYDWLEENPGRFAQQLWRDRQRLNFLYGL